MTDPAGGFFSAEDADSVPPDKADLAGARKAEGAYYLWAVDEVRAMLGDASRVVELRYGLLPNGNAPSDPHHEFEGRNILYTARTISDVARETGLAPAEVASRLLDARARLFEAARRRPRPELDDKVLTAWNGLMIAAFARAARVLGGGAALDHVLEGEDPGVRHRRTAERAAGFVRRVMWDPARRVLLRRYRRGHAAIEGFAEDYAFLVFGLLELFQASGAAEWLDWAVELQRRQDELFADAESGGWFSTTGADASVLVRAKEDYDGAEPAASSVSVLNLLALAHLTGDSAWRAGAERGLESAAARLDTQGRAVPLMAAALAVALAPPEQVVIVGPRGREDTEALWHGAHRRFRPFAVMIPVEPGEPQRALAARLPWVAAMRMIDDRATAYVCRDFVCEAPVTDPGPFDR
jgi:hypothetical protein